MSNNEVEKANEQAKELAHSEPQFKQVGFLRFDSLESAEKSSQILSKSNIVPKGFIGKPYDIMVAVQHGFELGMQPLQALQNIAVINGRPTIWGDAMLAICKSKADCEDVIETWDARTQTATCRVKIYGKEDVVQTFSVEQAKRAGLTNRDTWKSYTERMCAMRARGFALRNAFPHHLRGIGLAEEAQDQTHAERYKKAKEVKADFVVTQDNKSKVELIEDLKYLVMQKGASEKLEDFLSKKKVSSVNELSEQEIDSCITKLAQMPDVSQADALADRV